MASPFPLLLLCLSYALRLTLLMTSLSDRELVLLGFLDNIAITSKSFDNCDTSLINLRYRDPFTNNQAKESFDQRWVPTLCHLGLTNSPRHPVSSILHSKPVFVTAFSENHFLDGLAFLSRFSATLAREKLTNVTVYLYDLGIRRTRLDQLKKRFSHFLTIRQFPFELYPGYVAKLKQYRWKPLIIADVLKLHDSLWWMDSSVRVSSIKNLVAYYSNLTWCTSAETCPQYPLTLVSHSSHSIYAATTPGMYDYFPMRREDAIKVSMWGATVFVVFGTPEVRKDVLFWWVLCALEKDCMAPPGHRVSCDWRRTQGDRYTRSAQCNRYDQSALNVLVALANKLNETKYVRINGSSLAIDKLQ